MTEEQEKLIRAVAEGLPLPPTNGDPLAQRILNPEIVALAQVVLELTGPAIPTIPPLTDEQVDELRRPFRGPFYWMEGNTIRSRQPFPVRPSHVIINGETYLIGEKIDPTPSHPTVENAGPVYREEGFGKSLPESMRESIKAAQDAARHALDQAQDAARPRWQCDCGNPPFEGEELMKQDGALRCPNCQRPLSGDPAPLDSEDIANCIRTIEEALGEKTDAPADFDSERRVRVRDELAAMVNHDFAHMVGAHVTVDRILDRLIDASYGRAGCGFLCDVKNGVR